MVVSSVDLTQLNNSNEKDNYPADSSVFFGPSDELFYFVVVEGVLAVPKNLLKLACLYSLYKFDLHINLNSELNEKELLGYSKVILSTVVENLTVINYRKKIIEQHFINSQSKLPSEFEQLKQDEIAWLDILFSSKLPKHTKSPMLWEHRKWLISLDTVSHPVLLKPQERLNFLEKELIPILNAADIHPKNYYSWAYLRWLLREFNFIQMDSLLIEPLFDKVFEFCKNHISDISSWTFLFHLLIGLPDSTAIISNEFIDEPCNRSRVQHVLEQAVKLSKMAPNHETLYLFVKWATDLLSSKT